MEIPRPPSRQPLPDDATKFFSGKIFDIYQWEQKQFDGTTKTFEKASRADSTVVFPVTREGKIILGEQEQPGKPPFIGGLGGRVEKGESPHEAAKRELLEESGYEASEWVLWKAEQPISKIEWAVYTFIAKGLQKVANQSLDSGERVVLREYSFDEFLALAFETNFAEKEIVPAMCEALIDERKREELRKLFSP